MAQCLRQIDIIVSLTFLKNLIFQLAKKYSDTFTFSQLSRPREKSQDFFDLFENVSEFQVKVSD